jgi:phage terminase small subunit
MRDLTPKQRMFVSEYLIDLNATQAAVRAGYCATFGCQLSAKPHISRAIEEALKERSKKAGIDAQWVLDNLVEVSQRCMQKSPVMEFDPASRQIVQATDDEGRAIWSFDSKGANQALQLIGKHLGMFVDRREISGPQGLPIQAITMTSDEFREIANDVLDKF